MRDKNVFFLFLCFCELNVFAYHIPVDFIVAVDTSASMGFAVEQVNSAMSLLFTTASSFTDIRTIMIADNSVCIPQPLGSGSCTNDSRLPDYAHIYQAVGSTTSLEVVNRTFSLWSPLVSNTSLVVLCVISDDDTRTNPDQFFASLRAQSESIAQRFRFYAVTRITPGAIDPYCGTSSPVSARYQSLVEFTQGYITEICSMSRFTFDDIAIALYQHTFVNDTTTGASTTSLTTAVTSTTETTTTTSTTAVSSTTTAASTATSTTSVSTTDESTTTGATGATTTGAADATTTGATSSSTSSTTGVPDEDASGGSSTGVCVAYVILSILVQAMI